MQNHYHNCQCQVPVSCVYESTANTWAKSSHFTKSVVVYISLKNRIYQQGYNLIAPLADAKGTFINNFWNLRLMSLIFTKQINFMTRKMLENIKSIEHTYVKNSTILMSTQRFTLAVGFFT